MRKGLLAGMALALLLGLSANGARAGGKIDENTIDFSKLTCKELLDEVADDIKKGKPADEAAGMNMLMAAMWIDGYLSHETGDTQTTQQWIHDILDAIGNACKKPSKQTLMQVVRDSVKH